MTDDELLPIGRFARASGLTIGALRHYDEEGVLVPADVDPATGYRRYRRDQLQMARAVAALRDLELSIPAIRALLDADDPATRATILQDERVRLEARTARLQRALHRLHMLSITADQRATAATPDADEPPVRSAASPTPRSEDLTVPTPPPPPTLDAQTHRALAAGLERGAEVHPASPRVSAELPETGERFEGLLPPVVTAPAFAIRKPAVAIFTLDDYVAAGILTVAQAEGLRNAVRDRQNILVAGGTSTGKTTLTNALLAEIAKTADRVVMIEDTRELQCKSANLVALRTKDGVASLSDLVRSSLRLRPDRIPIGEVRGAEALDALHRLEQLIQEAVITVPRALIAETIDVITVLSGRGADRRLTELARVDGLTTEGDYLISPAGDPS